MDEWSGAVDKHSNPTTPSKNQRRLDAAVPQFVIGWARWERAVDFSGLNLRGHNFVRNQDLRRLAKVGSGAGLGARVAEPSEKVSREP